MLTAVLIGFLYVLLKVAIVIFVAYCIVWLARFVGFEIDGNVYKWGQIIVALICIIIVVVWLVGVLSGVVASPRLF